jgi:hypothetical protein
VTLLPPPSRVPPEVVCSADVEPPPSSRNGSAGRGPQAIRPDALADVLEALRRSLGDGDPKK